jgi:hypothetical protein
MGWKASGFDFKEAVSKPTGTGSAAFYYLVYIFLTQMGNLLRCRYQSKRKPLQRDLI